eukprot:TRINITY_DN5327_c0_g2_i1.p1 TRINITY_DN5327_c0_g2~~TRINITY_DN5327_c0_g2_i1.p1  ORF type:complete len:270 (+),score=59.80 TRINITY_DN5327_c0_g2_i1:86-895(+)
MVTFLSLGRRPCIRLMLASMSTSAAEVGVVQNLRNVLERASKAAERASPPNKNVRVVAVSKTKPVPLLMEAYNAGQRHFGENYVQELIEKSPQMPEDVKWHFIGHLQSNKAKLLLEKVANLWMVETVDGIKIANFLERACSATERSPLKVLVQVNTSGEESKSGVDPGACVELVRHVREECPHLHFSGLMTIGMLDYTSTPQNFQTLVACKKKVCLEFGIPEEDCELSMGMSGDFELAIEMGSTNVRAGSTIFGAREYKPKSPPSSPLK